MIGGCARIIIVICLFSTKARGSQNGVTEIMFSRIFAPDTDVPEPYKSLDGAE